MAAKARLQETWFWLRFHFARRFKPEGGLVDGLVRGLGHSRFTWVWMSEETDARLVSLMEAVDAAICRAPCPLGIDEFLVRVQVFGRHPEDGSEIVPTVHGRPLLHEFTLEPVDPFLISRHRDWRSGQARPRLENLLRQHRPSLVAPMLAVSVISMGGLVLELAKEGKVCLPAYRPRPAMEKPQVDPTVRGHLPGERLK
jgi:hypothetical protein